MVQRPPLHSGSCGTWALWHPARLVGCRGAPETGDTSAIEQLILVAMRQADHCSCAMEMSLFAAIMMKQTCTGKGTCLELPGASLAGRSGRADS